MATQDISPERLSSTVFYLVVAGSFAFLAAVVIVMMTQAGA